MFLEKLRFGHEIKENEKELEPKDSTAPIEVLITPDGKVVSTSLDDRIEVKPEEMVQQSEDSVKGRPGKSSLPNGMNQSERGDESASGRKHKPSRHTDAISTKTVQRKKTNTQKLNSTPIQQRKNSSLKCGVCQKEYQYKCYYDAHMQGHTGKYKFPCDKCQKGFTTRYGYDEHMRSHQGKYYKCHRCGKKFASRYGLQRHMQHHTGFRYKCDICQKGFTQASHFKDHMRKHEGKSFVCRICEKTYLCARSLQRHLKCHMAAEKDGQ